MKIKVLGNKKCAASHFNNWKLVLIFGAAMIFGLAHVSFGQTITAPPKKIVKPANQMNALSGVISDNFGAAVDGVEVKISKGGKKQSFSAISNADGKYRFSNLPNGVYTFEIKPKTGFRSYKSFNISIKGGGESQYDITLKAIGKRPNPASQPKISSGNF